MLEPNIIQKVKWKGLGVSGKEIVIVRTFTTGYSIELLQPGLPTSHL